MQKESLFVVLLNILTGFVSFQVNVFKRYAIITMIIIIIIFKVFYYNFFTYSSYDSDEKYRNSV